MATLVIRNLDPALHTRLEARAAAAGRSMEEEARRLLRDVSKPSRSLAERRSIPAAEAMLSLIAARRPPDELALRRKRRPAGGGARSHG
jgi:plasmid stability protein